MKTRDILCFKGILAALLIGLITILLCKNQWFLDIIAKASQIRLNILDIKSWLQVFMIL